VARVPHGWLADATSAAGTLAGPAVAGTDVPAVAGTVAGLAVAEGGGAGAAATWLEHPVAPRSAASAAAATLARMAVIPVQEGICGRAVGRVGLESTAGLHLPRHFPLLRPLISDTQP